MLKIKDRIILGIVSGVIASLPGRFINALEYRTGLTDIQYDQMASSLFLPKNKIKTGEAKVTGSIINHTMVGLTGILITYLLSATGRDKAMIKGIGVTSALWITIYGLAPKFGVKVKSKKTFAPILSFIDHALLGSLCGFFSSKLGHDSLFPDTQISDQNANEKLPLFSFKR